MAEALSVSSPPETDRERSEAETRQWGQRLFDLMDRAEPRWFRRKRIYGALMDWTMRDERLKTQLFRFIDVLPSLHSPAAVSQHFQEYLGNEHRPLFTPLAVALQAAQSAPSLFGVAVQRQVAIMARQFILGNSDRAIVKALHQRQHEHIGFTVDVLGETVVSEDEADHYAQRYLELIDLLAREDFTAASSPASPDKLGSPQLNLSVKVSALCSHIQPTDPERALQRIAARLRPILRRAQEAGGLINLDMESMRSRT